MKLLIMQFSPNSRHVISLWTKYSPQHPVLKHPQWLIMISKGKWKKLGGKPPLQCHFVHHEPQMTSPGSEPEAPLSEGSA
jgi:hypothetical protein